MRGARSRGRIAESWNAFPPNLMRAPLASQDANKRKEELASGASHALWAPAAGAGASPHQPGLPADHPRCPSEASQWLPAAASFILIVLFASVINRRFGHPTYFKQHRRKVTEHHRVRGSSCTSPPPPSLEGLGPTIDVRLPAHLVSTEVLPFLLPAEVTEAAQVR